MLMLEGNATAQSAWKCSHKNSLFTTKQRYELQRRYLTSKTVQIYIITIALFTIIPLEDHHKFTILWHDVMKHKLLCHYHLYGLTDCPFNIIVYTVAVGDVISVIRWKIAL